MNSNHMTAQLNEILTKMLSQAESLARIIVEEGIALREADVDRLNEAVNNQKSFVIELSAFDSSFRSLITQMGYQDGSDVGDFLAKTVGNKTVQDQWTTYLEVIKQCERQNRTNGALVNVGLKHTRQAIEFLHSCVGENNTTELYGPHSQSSSRESYVIAKA